MNDLIHRPGPDALAPTHGGLLSPALQRDLADLNAQYLELGLTTGLEGDPRFGWAEPVRRCLLDTDPATRERIAAAPFALFDLLLPARLPEANPARVQDAGHCGAPSGWLAKYSSFAHQAVFLARRLVDGEPLALRVLLGVPDDGRAWLADCRLAQLADVATHPCMVRPRWRLHQRFWERLVGAARRGTPDAVQWAHCIGLCLLGASEGEVVPGPHRRPRR